MSHYQIINLTEQGVLNKYCIIVAYNDCPFMLLCSFLTLLSNMSGSGPSTVTQQHTQVGPH